MEAKKKKIAGLDRSQIELKEDLKFGLFLRSIRKSVYLSQKEMVKKLGCSLHHLSYVEKGGCPQTFDTAKKFVEAFEHSSALIFEHFNDDSSFIFEQLFNCMLRKCRLKFIVVVRKTSGKEKSKKKSDRDQTLIDFEENLKFGKLICSIRQNNGLSQTGVANKLKCSKQYISNIEIAVNHPTFGMARKLSGVFKDDSVNIFEGLFNSWLRKSSMPFKVKIVKK